MGSLAQYAGMLQLSQRMLSAARASDWDELIQLESQRSGMLQAMKAAGGNPVPEAQRQESETMIREILACDDEIRLLVKPWMDEAGDILASLAAARKLQQAYK